MLENYRCFSTGYFNTSKSIQVELSNKTRNIFSFENLSVVAVEHLCCKLGRIVNDYFFSILTPSNGRKRFIVDQRQQFVKKRIQVFQWLFGRFLCVMFFLVQEHISIKMFTDVFNS